MDRDKNYQAFLSHAGEDKETIAIPLEERLRSLGVHVFLDKRSLEVGDHAHEEMEFAMETARVAIILLSPEFAAKRWPMKELQRFLERIAEAQAARGIAPLIIPVFYRLSISDCSDKKVFKSKNEEGDNVFVKNDFFDRMEAKETNQTKILNTLGKLRSMTGIENEEGATNNDTEEMREKRGKLINRIAGLVEAKVKAVCASPAASTQTASASATAGGDIFSAWFDVPNMSSIPNVVLDFTSRGSQNDISGDTSSEVSGNFKTMEGRLKNELASTLDATFNRRDLYSTAPVGSAVIVVVIGMGGVGKSCAMIGLGWEEDIRSYFKDGIYFLKIGQGASQSDVCREIARIVEISGGEKHADRIRGRQTLREAVSIAAKWFDNKQVLFLIDDLWGTTTCTTGFLEELDRLRCPKARIVVSTRSSEIGSAARNPVSFIPRERVGGESVCILARYAGIEEAEVENNRGIFNGILLGCSGFPLALGIAGRAIREYISDGYRELHVAAKHCLDDIEQDKTKLVRSGLGAYTPSILDIVSMSLGVIDDWGVKREAVGIFGGEIKVSLLYFRLALLRKQDHVPFSMLSKLWGLEEWQARIVARKLAGLNLATLNPNLGVHDLLLDICSRQIGGNTTKVQAELLERYAPPSVLRSYEIRSIARSNALRQSDVVPGSCLSEPGVSHLGNIVRGWWVGEFPDDEYLVGNLARHLVGSENVIELAELLLEARWAERRVRYGNISLWREGFGILERALTERSSDADASDLKIDLSSFELIRDAIAESWTILVQNPSELAYQMHSRLLGCDENTPLVGIFLKSARENTEKPWLRPWRRTMAVPGGSLLLNIPFRYEVGAFVASRVCSHAYVGVGREIWVIELESGKVLHALTGHKDEVSCIAISENEQVLVSGSRDWSVRVWDTAKRSELRDPLRSGYASVLCVAINQDGTMVVSGYNDGAVRAWSIDHVLSSASENLLVVHEKEGVLGVAIHPDGRRIFYLTTNGTLRIFETGTRNVVWNWGGISRSRPISLQPWCRCFALSLDGRFMVTGSENTLLVWNVDHVDHVNIARVGDELDGHEDRVSCVAFSPCGGYIASGSWDKTVQIWEVKTLKPMRHSVRGHWDIRSVGFSFDSLQALSTSYGDKSLNVWKAESTFSRAAMDEGVANNCSVEVTCMNLSRDGMYIATGSRQGFIGLWETLRGKEIGKTLGYNVDATVDIAMSTDNRYVVSATHGKLRLWRTQCGGGGLHAIVEGSIVLVSEVAICIPAAPGGYDHSKYLHHLKIFREVIGNSPDNGSAPNGLKDMKVSEEGIICEISLDDVLVADWRIDGLCGFVRNQYAVDVYSTSRYVSLNMEEAQSNLLTANDTGGASDCSVQVTCVDLSPDEKYIVTGSRDGVIRVRETESGQEMRKSEAIFDAIYFVAMSADNRYVVSASYRKLRLWRTNSIHLNGWQRLVVVSEVEIYNPKRHEHYMSYLRSLREGGKAFLSGPLEGRDSEDERIYNARWEMSRYQAAQAAQAAQLPSPKTYRPSRTYRPSPTKRSSSPERKNWLKDLNLSEEGIICVRSLKDDVFADWKIDEVEGLVRNEVPVDIPFTWRIGSDDGASSSTRSRGQHGAVIRDMQEVRITRPVEKILATLPGSQQSYSAYAAEKKSVFDARKNLLVTSHRNGSLLFHTIER